MTDEQKIAMLRTALQEAYTHITQPKKMQDFGYGVTKTTYIHTSDKYNHLTSKIRAAMMATE